MADGVSAAGARPAAHIDIVHVPHPLAAWPQTSPTALLPHPQSGSRASRVGLPTHCCPLSQEPPLLAQPALCSRMRAPLQERGGSGGRADEGTLGEWESERGQRVATGSRVCLSARRGKEGE